MSINGVTNPLLANLSALGRPDALRPLSDRATQARAGSSATSPATLTQPALRAQAPIAGPAAAQSVVPSDAPAGTDPALWSVLTNDERNFFAKSAALGPLTYGRIKAVSHPTPPSVRGVRLDVRA
jgi:hypothetical protein